MFEMMTIKPVQSHLQTSAILAIELIATHMKDWDGALFQNILTWEL